MMFTEENNEQSFTNLNFGEEIEEEVEKVKEFTKKPEEKKHSKFNNTLNFKNHQG